MLLFLLILIGTFFEAFGIGLVLPLIISITSDFGSSSNYLLDNIYSLLNLSNQREAIVFFVSTLIIVSIIKFLYLSFLAWYQMSYSFGLLARISNSILKNYMFKDYFFHIQNNSSILIRNTINEVNLLTTNSIIPSLQLITEFTVLSGIFLLLLYIEPYGAFSALFITIFASSVFYYFTNKRILKWGSLRQEYDGKKIQRLQESFGGIKEINLLGAQDFFINRFVRENFGFADVSAKHSATHQIPRLWIEMLAIASIGVLLSLMIEDNSDFSVIIAKLGVFAAAALRILPSATRIMSSIQLLKFSQPIIKTISSELNHQNIQTSLTDDLKLNLENSIDFDSVSFSYEDNTKMAINNVSLSIKKGETIGILGPSGAGKTTLVDLLLGLIEPTSGGIYVDKTNIHESLKNWQSKIGYVPQNIFLTDDTLKNNIAFGLNENDIDDEKLSRAIELSQLSKFVDSLEMGFNTNMGERGSRLSGGQRQRIGIARALYHNPDILILDEATSALDLKTEADFLDVIKGFKNQKTIIIITHRESTLQNMCNKILRINHGCILQD